MKEEPIITINRITMYVWLFLGLVTLIFSVYDYFIEEEVIMSRVGISNNTALVAAILCFLMFGWKKFQLAKFASNGKL